MYVSDNMCVHTAWGGMSYIGLQQALGVHTCLDHVTVSKYMGAYKPL